MRNTFFHLQFRKNTSLGLYEEGSLKSKSEGSEWKALEIQAKLIWPVLLKKKVLAF